jgi:aryl-alcohol dehydrogenase-like predicted oxidoreductase
LPLVQVQYSLIDLRPENGMLAFAREHRLKLACFGTVAGGWLSDRFLGLAAPPRQLSTVSMRMYKANLDRWGSWALFQELLGELKLVADRHGTTIANIAVCWVLRQLGPQGGWVVLGVRDTTHLEEHKKLAKLIVNGANPISDEDEARIRKVLQRGNPPKGDIWSYERGLA